MKRLLIGLTLLSSMPSFADPFAFIEAHTNGCKRQLKRILKEENIEFNKVKWVGSLYTGPLTHVYDVFDGDDVVATGEMVKHKRSKCELVRLLE